FTTFPFSHPPHPPPLHPFPTRRSSDLLSHRLPGMGQARKPRALCKTWWTFYNKTSISLSPLPAPAPRAIPRSRNRRNRRRTYGRSEEHTSELQSLAYLVCRLLLEKKKQ